MNERRREENRGLRLAIDAAKAMTESNNRLTAKVDEVIISQEGMKKDIENISAKVDKHDISIHGNGKPGLKERLDKLETAIGPWLTRGHKLTDWLLGLLVVGAAVFVAYLRGR